MDFIKCSALGNEFIVLIDTPLPSPGEARKICNASKGPGGDGIIHLSPKKTALNGLVWCPTVINCDGSDGGFSGNGLRCGALCIISKKSSELSGMEKPEGLNTISFDLNGEIIKARAKGSMVSLLFKPSFANSRRPLTPEMKDVDYEGILKVNSVLLQYLDVGNPHLIINTGEEEPSFSDEMNRSLDELRQCDTLLTGGVNVSVITKIGRGDYKITTFERGVGITPSCGSASLAALISLENTQALKSASFTSKGGIINLSKENNKILMTGNVKKIFDGSYDMVNNRFTKK